MPIEYANYKPFDQQIDWASVSTDVSKKALEIGEDRKNRKAALDKMKSDYELKLAEQKAFKTEDVTAKWGETTNQGRDVIYNAYKDLKSRKITESDYKNIVNNLTTYTDKLADHATALDTDIQAYIARQQVDEKTGEAQGGAFELEKLNRLGKIADLKDKKFNVLPDGRISIDQMGEDGKVLESSFDLMSFNKKENQFAPRVYVDKLTSNIVKDWAKWSEFKDLGSGAWRNIEDIRRNPATRDALYMAVKSVNSTPKNTLSVLIDNGAIQQPLYAYSVSEIDKVKAQAEQDLINMRTSQGVSTEITAADKADIDKRIIRVDPTNGEPILTDEQKKLADETVERSIQMKMGHEEKGGGKENWTRASSGGGDGGDGGSTNKDNTNYYPEMRRAWDMGGVTGADQLTTLAKGKAKFKFVNGGLKVFKPRTPDKRDKSIWEKEGEIVKDLASIQNFIYPENNKNFDIHRQQYINTYGTGNTVTGGETKPKVDKFGRPIK
jgi:hypothetical protein